MGVIWTVNFESGNLNDMTLGGATPTIDTGTVHAGTYSMKEHCTGGAQSYSDKGGFSLNTAFLKGWVFVDVTSNPSATSDRTLMTLYSGGSTLEAGLHLVVSNTGVVSLQANDNLTGNLGSPVTINELQWYKIEVKVISGNPGTFEWRLGGVVQATDSARNMLTSPFDDAIFRLLVVNSGVADIWWDDMMLRDDAYDSEASATPVNVSISENLV